MHDDDDDGRGRHHMSSMDIDGDGFLKNDGEVNANRSEGRAEPPASDGGDEAGGGIAPDDFVDVQRKPSSHPLSPIDEATFALRKSAMSSAYACSIAGDSPSVAASSVFTAPNNPFRRSVASSACGPPLPGFVGGESKAISSYNGSTIDRSEYSTGRDSNGPPKSIQNCDAANGESALGDSFRIQRSAVSTLVEEEVSHRDSFNVRSSHRSGLSGSVRSLSRGSGRSGSVRSLSRVSSEKARSLSRGSARSLSRGSARSLRRRDRRGGVVGIDAELGTMVDQVEHLQPQPQQQLQPQQQQLQQRHQQQLHQQQLHQQQLYQQQLHQQQLHQQQLQQQQLQQQQLQQQQLQQQQLQQQQHQHRGQWHQQQQQQQEEHRQEKEQGRQEQTLGASLSRRNGSAQSLRSLSRGSTRSLSMSATDGERGWAVNINAELASMAEQIEQQQQQEQQGQSQEQEQQEQQLGQQQQQGQGEGLDVSTSSRFNSTSLLGMANAPDPSDFQDEKEAEGATTTNPPYKPANRSRYTRLLSSNSDLENSFVRLRARHIIRRETDNEDEGTIINSKALLSDEEIKKKKCLKWCLFFSSLLCLGAASFVCWLMLVHLKKEGTAVEGNDHVSTKSNLTKKDVGGKIILPWDANATCAPFSIKVVTDKFGNETSWELFYLESEEGTMTAEARRKRLRPHSQTVGKGNSRNLGSRTLVVRGGPYPYLDISDPTYIPGVSGTYNFSISLPLGHFQFVAHDASGNGMCCEHGLGDYVLYFQGGREVYASTGQFAEDEVTSFEVMEEDVLESIVGLSTSATVAEDVVSKIDMAPPTHFPKDSKELFFPSFGPIALSPTMLMQSSIPSSLEPTTRWPTTYPSVSLMPSTSGVPTEPPSASLMPSASLLPSTLPSASFVPSTSIVPSPNLAYTSISVGIGGAPSQSPTASLEPSPSYPPSSEQSQVTFTRWPTTYPSVSLMPSTSGVPTAPPSASLMPSASLLLPSTLPSASFVPSTSIVPSSNLAYTSISVGIGGAPSQSPTASLEPSPSYPPSSEQSQVTFTTNASSISSSVIPTQSFSNTSTNMSNFTKPTNTTTIIPTQSFSNISTNMSNFTTPKNTTTVPNFHTTQPTPPLEISTNLSNITTSILLEGNATETSMPSPQQSQVTTALNFSPSQLPAITSTGTANQSNLSSLTGDAANNPFMSNSSSPPALSPAPTISSSAPSFMNSYFPSDSISNSPSETISSPPSTTSSPSIKVSNSPSDKISSSPSITSSPSGTVSNSPSETFSSSPSITSSPSTLSPTASFIPTKFEPILDFAKSLLLEGKNPSSQFGFSTSISGDGSLLAVGAKDAWNEFGEATGAVYLYSLHDFVNNAASSTESDSSTPPKPFAVLYGLSVGDEFGSSVALSQDGVSLVVGSPAESTTVGRIRIYQIIDDIVTLIHVISGQSPSGKAGWSVAISGDRNVIAMGAINGGPGGGGSVTTYRAPAWIQFGGVLEGLEGDEAGFSIALSYDGAFMAIGSPRADQTPELLDSGKTAVYAIDGGEWSLRDEIYGGNARRSAVLDGSSIGLSGDGSILVVGGKGYNWSNGGKTRTTGRCKIFEWKESQFELLHAIIGERTGEQLGTSVAVSDDGNIVACGGVGGRYVHHNPTTSGLVRLWNRLTTRTKSIWPEGNTAFLQGASFGSAVSLSSDGKLLVIGASTSKGSNVAVPGAVQVFDTEW